MFHPDVHHRADARQSRDGGGDGRRRRRIEREREPPRRGCGVRRDAIACITVDSNGAVCNSGGSMGAIAAAVSREYTRTHTPGRTRPARPFPLRRARRAAPPLAPPKISWRGRRQPFRATGVHHVRHVRDRQRRLRDVRGEHDLPRAGGRRRERALLLLRGELAVEGNERRAAKRTKFHSARQGSRSRTPPRKPTPRRRPRRRFADACSHRRRTTVASAA